MVSQSELDINSSVLDFAVVSPHSPLVLLLVLLVMLVSELMPKLMVSSLV